MDERKKEGVLDAAAMADDDMGMDCVRSALRAGLCNNETRAILVALARAAAGASEEEALDLLAKWDAQVERARKELD